MAEMDGTLVVEIVLPHPWPLSEKAIFSEYQFVGGRIEVASASSGGLMFTLYEDADEPNIVDRVETSPLLPSGGRRAKVACAWSGGKIEAVACQSLFIFSHDGSVPVVPFVEVATPSEKASIDFSAENEAERVRRRSKLESWTERSGRHQGNLQYLLEALDDERKQLADLVQLVLEGRQHHFPGISSRIRLLVYNRPFGLLQHVAALLDAPLIVYTTANPITGDVEEPEYRFSVSAAARQIDVYTNPIDLVVWLGTPALTAGGKTLSVVEVVKAIGDKIGSHRDVDIDPNVAVMMRRKSVAGDRYNDIAEFLIHMARLLIDVSGELLDRTSAEQ